MLKNRKSGYSNEDFVTEIFENRKKSNEPKKLNSNQIFATKNRLLTAQELADILGLSIWTIRKWRSLEIIPYIKLGRAVRYNLFEVTDSLIKRR